MSLPVACQAETDYLPLSRIAATPFFTARSVRHDEHEHCLGQGRVCFFQTDLEIVVRKDFLKSGAKRDFLVQREATLIASRFLRFASEEGDPKLLETRVIALSGTTTNSSR